MDDHFVNDVIDVENQGTFHKLDLGGGACGKHAYNFTPSS